MQQVFKETMRLMGNQFEISAVSDEKAWAQHRIALAVGEIQRIERLLTTFDENSQTNLINQNAGIQPIRVEKEVFDLVARSLRISTLTQGAFDITYGSIDKSLWNFDTKMKTLPSAEVAAQSVALIDYRNVILDAETQSIFLKHKGTRIGFGGIGKGYAAERAKQIMLDNDVKSGIVNASGDLVAWGNQPNGKPWTVGIASPQNRWQALASMNISDKACATSGDYEKYVVIDGKRYSHTIDPKTGMPASGIKSVTIVTTNAELADAMTTPIVVMGIKAGLHLINQMKQIACIIIDENDQMFTSDNIRLK
jgi:FAD:protein FMN transferase